MIALVDYRAGNLTSVRKAFGALGAELFTPALPADLAAGVAALDGVAGVYPSVVIRSILVPPGQALEPETQFDQAHIVFV